jgi:transposase-like protein
VLESALRVEMAEHLGYEHSDPSGHGSGNSRNGITSKTVRTDVGDVRIDVPRDRAGTFRSGGLDFPVVIRKLIYTTDGIESLNARFRQSTRRRGHFPNEQSAMKILYLTVKDIARTDRTRPGRSTAGSPS